MGDWDNDYKLGREGYPSSWASNYSTWADGDAARVRDNSAASRPLSKAEQEAGEAVAGLVLLVLWGLVWVIYQAFRQYARLPRAWEIAVGALVLAPWALVMAGPAFPAEGTTLSLLIALAWFWIGAFVVYFPLAKFTPGSGVGAWFLYTCYSLFPIVLCLMIQRNFGWWWWRRLGAADSAAELAYYVAVALVALAVTGVSITIWCSIDEDLLRRAGLITIRAVNGMAIGLGVLVLVRFFRAWLENLSDWNSDALFGTVGRILWVGIVVAVVAAGARLRERWPELARRLSLGAENLFDWA